MNVQADEKNSIQMKSGTLIATRVPNSEAYFEPLEQLIPMGVRRTTKNYPDLDDFIRKNAHKYCASRKIKCATSWLSVGTFIQVFENKKSADDFSQIGQKIKEPWWAPGVIGVIGFDAFEDRIIEAEEFVRFENNKVISKNLLAQKNGRSPIVVIDIPDLFHKILSPEMNAPRILRAPAVK